MARHTDERPHVCKMWGCLAAFKSKNELQHHLMRHSGVRNWPCSICPSSFKTKRELHDHKVGPILLYELVFPDCMLCSGLHLQVWL